MIPQPIKKLLEKDQTISQLNLSNCGLYDKDILELETLLKNNSHITSINLERNNITSEGVKPLSHIPGIRKLNLRQNKIEDDGVEYLLAHNVELAWLNIGLNALTEKSAQLLLEKLSKKETLSYANVSGNEKINNEITHQINCFEKAKTYEQKGDTSRRLSASQYSIYTKLSKKPLQQLTSSTIATHSKEINLAKKVLEEHSQEVSKMTQEDKQKFINDIAKLLNVGVQLVDNQNKLPTNVSPGM